MTGYSGHIAWSPLKCSKGWTNKNYKLLSKHNDNSKPYKIDILWSRSLACGQLSN